MAANEKLPFLVIRKPAKLRCFKGGRLPSGLMRKNLMQSILLAMESDKLYSVDLLGAIHLLWSCLQLSRTASSMLGLPFVQMIWLKSTKKTLPMTTNAASFLLKLRRAGV